VETCSRGLIVVLSRHLLGETKKIRKSLSKDRRSPAQDLNSGPPPPPNVSRSATHLDATFGEAAFYNLVSTHQASDGIVETEFEVSRGA
jgi:hypothetical protein